MTMAEDNPPSDKARGMMAQNIDHARNAMASYFRILEKQMSKLPLGETEQAKAFRSYVERNVAASFKFSDKLLHAKDFEDVVRLQAEFFQTQLQALTEESKGLGEEASKAASEVINIPIK
jgi:hypothetical protein